MKKKIALLALTAVCLFGGVLTPVSLQAKSTPATKPNFDYGTRLEVVNYDKRRQVGPFPGGFYQVYNSSYYYNWDCDEFACYASRANKHLSTTNTSTVSVSAGAKADFAGFIEAETSFEAGEQWTKTSEVTYDAKKGYNYVLWSANRISKQIYYYNSKRNAEYTALLPSGHKEWFFRERL